jgi:hypothetical protein
MDLPYKIIDVLLKFSSVILYILKNRITIFEVEILPTDKATSNYNVLKISAQKKVPFTRYWVPKNLSYSSKDSRTSCFFGNSIFREGNILLS